MSIAGKRILFLTTDLPYPAVSGGRLKTFKLLEYLSTRCEVKVLCAYGGERTADLKALKQTLNLSGVQAFQNHKPRTPFHFFNALMTAPSFNAYRIYSKEMETMIKWSIAQSDLVIMDHLELVDMLPEGPMEAPLVYHSHNAEYVLWNDYAKIKGNFFTSWVFDWEAQRVQLLERYALRKSRLSFAAPNDRQALEKIPGVEGIPFAETFHLGNDGMLDFPNIDLGSNKPNVFYAGTLSWEPNRDGLQWFVQSVWPSVKEQVSDARLLVCGSGASPELVHILKQKEGVEYLGFVDDLEHIMSSCRAAVVPLRMGSGMKIKSFDALYRGLPLVTTPTGAEGIELENNTHAMVVEDPDAFAKALTTILNDPTLATKLRDNGRALCEERYRYSTLLSEMESALDQVV